MSTPTERKFRLERPEERYMEKRCGQMVSGSPDEK
jgi:hypothetical protein